MLRGKLPPVWMDELQNVLWDAIEVGGALGVDQVVLGVYVDAMFWFAGLHPLNKIFQGQQDIYLVWGGGSNAKMFFVQEHYIADPDFQDYAKASLCLGVW